MNLEERVKEQLLIRGFSKEMILNNRGLIGATIDETALMLVKNLTIPVVMPRYFIDERTGCAAVRDREHPKYDKDYPGLHYDTPDVVEYKHGRTEGGRWIVEPEDLEYLQKLCKDLNGA